MKPHPREEIVTRARLDLMEKLLDWAGGHDLTTPELISILGDILGDQITAIAKLLVREERHPGKPSWLG